MSEDPKTMGSQRVELARQDERLKAIEERLKSLEKWRNGLLGGVTTLGGAGVLKAIYEALQR